MKLKTMNRFENDLRYSMSENDNDKFNDLYKRAFPHLAEIEIVSDLGLQKKGVDKIIHFESGKKILIDEKKRRKDYGDILLEEYSDFDKKKVGWLGRDKYTDYIVYAIVPSGVAYFFPFNLLQMSWIENCREWADKYGRKFAQNNGYRTSNIPIPKHVLINSLRDKMILNF